MRRAIFMAALLLGGACGGEGEAPEDDGKPEEERDPEVDPNLRIGHVMVEVGHRFESAGRAAEAENWGFATYQVQEILEMFQLDMRRALLPGDCDDAVADQMYENLLDQLPVMHEAGENENAAGFREHFATASGYCNGCHAGCNVAFIRVPSAMGAEVPMIATPAPEPTPVTELPAPEEAVLED